MVSWQEEIKARRWPPGISRELLLSDRGASARCAQPRARVNSLTRFDQVKHGGDGSGVHYTTLQYSTVPPLVSVLLIVRVVGHLIVGQQEGSIRGHPLFSDSL